MNSTKGYRNARVRSRRVRRLRFQLRVLRVERGGALALRLRPCSCEALHDNREAGTEVCSVERRGLQGATNVPSTSPYSATPTD